MASGSDRHVVLGIITGAHGIRGEVKLKSFTENPEAIAGYGPLDTGTGGTLEITALKPAKSGFVARLKGVADRNQAEALIGTELRLDRGKLPEPGKDQFYHADLVGLKAETPTGEPYGEVIAIHDFGAGELLEIRLQATSDTELIAFRAETVPKIDITAGRIVVVPPIEETEEED